ncbi:rhomboid family intramembrane serine protease [Candidatus Woesearchaeota archaeon]|nr:rhomboid family intramembrane serine protease [Candidatus Woesearchaeota archaeon]
MKIKFQSAVIPIIIANIVVFVLQLVLGTGFTESFMLISKEVFMRPWILVTSMFLHANINHLLFNMYALFIFGPLIEQRIGKKRFLFIYFLSGIVAALISTFFYHSALGASGAIMGILGVTIMLLPDLQVLLFFFIPMSMRTAGVIFALIDIFGIFVPSGVANIAHLVGLSLGIIYGYYLLKQKKAFKKRFERKVHTNSIEMGKDDINDYLRHGKL